MTLHENTLAKLAKRLLRVPLQDFIGGTCSGGSTTTVVDSTKLAEYADDYFQNTSPISRAVILSTTDGAAPVGEVRKASDHVQTGGTLTVSPAFTAAPASGDEYAVLSEYQWDEIVEAINSAIDIATSKGARIEKLDESTVIIQDDTFEYPVPSGFTEIYRITQEDDEHKFVEAIPPDQYKIIRGATVPRIHFFQTPVGHMGNDHYYGELWSEVDMTDDRVLRIEGLARQPKLEAAQDICYLNPDFVVWQAASLLQAARVSQVDFDEHKGRAGYCQEMANSFLPSTRIQLPPNTKKVIR